MEPAENKVILEHEQFNPDNYLLPRVLGKHCTPFNEEYAKGFARLLHEVFSTHEKGGKSGLTLLDVGCGPMIRNVLSASATYDTITLSDPLPQNRAMIQRFIDNSEEDERWMEHFKFTAFLEGDAGNWENVRDRARSAIRDVIWCDVTREPTLEGSALGSGSYGTRDDGNYDCVLAVLCLSVACQNEVDFEAAVKNLVSLTKPGAPIVLMEFLGVEFYQVGGKRYPCLAFTEELVRETLQKAGCTVKAFHIRVMSLPFGDEERRRPYFIVDARKHGDMDT